MAALDLTFWPTEIDALFAVTDDPHRRAILANFRRHVLLEISGLWPEILTPELTVDHPVYRMGDLSGAMTVYDGMDAVRDLYRGLAEAGATVMMPIAERMVVTDYGVVAEALPFASMGHGAALAASGFDADPAAHYLVEVNVMYIFEYDRHARLTGERNYVDSSSVVLRRLDPADVITTIQAREFLAPYLANPPTP